MNEKLTIKMTNKNKHNQQRGFSLLEILFSVAILGTILTGLIAVLTYSIKSNNQAQIRSAARDQAQAGIDYFRSERAVLGYNGLRSVLETEWGSPPATYCLDNLPSIVSTSVTSNNFTDGVLNRGLCASTETIGVEGVSADLTRYAEIDWSAADYINVLVTVEWLNDSGGTSSVVAESRLNRW